MCTPMSPTDTIYIQTLIEVRKKMNEQSTYCKPIHIHLHWSTHQTFTNVMRKLADDISALRYTYRASVRKWDVGAISTVNDYRRRPRGSTWESRSLMTWAGDHTFQTSPTRPTEHLGFIRRNIKITNKKIKDSQQSPSSDPVLEYASPVWDSYTSDNVNTLKRYNGEQPDGYYIDTIKPPVLTWCWMTCSGQS